MKYTLNNQNTTTPAIAVTSDLQVLFTEDSDLNGRVMLCQEDPDTPGTYLRTTVRLDSTDPAILSVKPANYKLEYVGKGSVTVITTA